jgi:hypothetical protein
MNWYGIAALRMVNLAWDLKLPGFTLSEPKPPQNQCD